MIIFIQAPTQEHEKLAILLSTFEVMDYQFIILPLDTKLLSKREVHNLLSHIMDLQEI